MVPPPTTTLVTIDDTSHELVVIDESTGAGAAEVTLNTTVSMCSTIFTRAGSLYTSGQGSLWEIDACTGATTEIASYSPTTGAGHPPSLCGLATRNFNDLYGLDLEDDTLVQIDPATAVVTVVGDTGVDFGTVGLTWDQPNDRFLAINGTDDNLYSVDVSTGSATLLANLDYDIGPVGVELDPVSGVLFACTGPDLLSVNITTGQVTVLGPIWNDPTCDDLGATCPIPSVQEPVGLAPLHEEA